MMLRSWHDGDNWRLACEYTLSEVVEAIADRETTTRPAFREIIDNLNWSEM
jgi:hypothetical protein